MKYNKLSLYRKEIMGIAILLIMISHNSMDFPGFFHNINSGIKMLGQLGVDIFFFLSGFGCYYSMTNNNNALIFYKRRFIRILPAYLIVIMLYAIISVILYNESLTEYLWRYSLVSFFTNAVLHEWFIASILLLYLLYPLIYRLIKNNHVAAFIMVGAVYLIIFSRISSMIPYSLVFVIITDIFITRVPAFLIGSICAELSLHGKKIKKSWCYILLILGPIVCGINLYSYKAGTPMYWTTIRTLFIILIFAVIIFWIFIREHFKDIKFIENACRFFSYIGAFTLEIYLLHEKILGILTPFFNGININNYISLFLLNIVAAIVSIFFADKLSKLVTHIVSRR